MGVLENLAKKANEALKNESDKVKQETIDALKSNGREIVDDLKHSAKEKIEKAAKEKKKKFKFDEIPSSLKELKEYDIADLQDEFGVAALVVMALNAYAEDEEAGKEMLDFLNGPTEFKKSDASFINDRFMDGKSYVVKSYFEGTDPEDDYETDKYVIKVSSNEYSYEEENYCKLYLESSGADSPRHITLRKKPSTGQWFVWDYRALLADVKLPASLDEWA